MLEADSKQGREPEIFPPQDDALYAVREGAPEISVLQGD
jgi:hypothetical protein